MDIRIFMQRVTQELEALKAIGVKVSKKAFSAAQDSTEMSEYEDMSTSECADLLREIYP